MKEIWMSVIPVMLIFTALPGQGRIDLMYETGVMQIGLDNSQGDLEYDQLSRHGVFLEYKVILNELFNIGVGLRYNRTESNITFREEYAYADNSQYRRQRIDMALRPEIVYRGAVDVFGNIGFSLGRELESRFYSGSFGVRGGTMSDYHPQMVCHIEVNTGIDLFKGPLGIRIAGGYVIYSPLKWSGMMSDFTTRAWQIQFGLWYKIPGRVRKRRRG